MSLVVVPYAEVAVGDVFLLAETVFERTRAGAHRLRPDHTGSGCVSQLDPATPVRVLG